MHSNKIFITGIGTDVGKTVVSAILCKAFGANYWKPVQAGELDFSDADKVRTLCGNSISTFPEKFRLNTPASPHYAAKIDGVTISEKDLDFPETKEKLFIEGAGGLMVPLNEDGLLYIDVLQKWNIPVVLVSRHYLGSINHTLMSLESLKNRNIEVKALIFVGEENQATESAILKQFPIKHVHRIPESKAIDTIFISEQAQKIPFRLFD